MTSAGDEDITLAATKALDEFSFPGLDVLVKEVGPGDISVLGEDAVLGDDVLLLRNTGCGGFNIDGVEGARTGQRTPKLPSYADDVDG